MSKKETAMTQGECLVCGLPGVIGMRCADRLCQGRVEGIQEAMPKPAGATARYDDDLIDANVQVLSLESLAEEEAEEP